MYHLQAQAIHYSSGAPTPHYRPVSYQQVFKNWNSSFSPSVRTTRKQKYAVFVNRNCQPTTPAPKEWMEWKNGTLSTPENLGLVLFRWSAALEVISTIIVANLSGSCELSTTHENAQRQPHSECSLGQWRKAKYEATATTNYYNAERRTSGWCSGEYWLWFEDNPCWFTLCSIWPRCENTCFEHETIQQIQWIPHMPSPWHILSTLYDVSTWYGVQWNPKIDFRCFVACRQNLMFCACVLYIKQCCPVLPTTVHWDFGNPIDPMQWPLSQWDNVPHWALSWAFMEVQRRFSVWWISYCGMWVSMMMLIWMML